MRRHRRSAARIDKRARAGILVQSLAFLLLWASDFWNHPPALWRVLLASLFFAVALLLVWTALRALGPQWRLDAGLNADHQLVRSGPYRIVRHPIYASMLCMLLGNGLLVTPLPLLAVSLAIYVIGTEIRVRVEDALLASRFGADFRAYQDNVAAYIPLVR